MLDIQHEPVQTLEKTKMWSMGSTTILLRYSKDMDSYVDWTRQKYWSVQRTWRCTQVKRHDGTHHQDSPWAEFDLMIAQIQIKDCEYSNSNKETLYCFSLKRSSSVLEKEQVRLSYYLKTLQVVTSAQPTNSEYPAQLLGQMSCLGKELAPELDIKVRWKPDDTSGKTPEYHEPPVRHWI